MDTILSDLCNRMREWSQRSHAINNMAAGIAVTTANVMPATLDLFGEGAVSRYVQRLRNALAEAGYRFDDQDNLERWMTDAEQRLKTLGF